MSLGTMDFGHSIEKNPKSDALALGKHPVSVGKPLKRRATRVSAIAIGLPDDHQIEGISLTHATKPRDVIEMLRVMDFGLLLVQAGPKDEEVWQMVRVVRLHWPGLRWVLFTENCTDQDEILARSLGASSVTADPRLLLELGKNRRGWK